MKRYDLNTEAAALFIANQVERAGFAKKLKCQIVNLLKENRRTEYLTLKDGSGFKHKGNRHVYGTIPLIYSSEANTGIALYDKNDLVSWVESTLLPVLAGRKS